MPITDEPKIEQITVDVMEALYRHRPDLLTVAKTLTEILSGVVLQVQKGPLREALRERIITHIRAEEDEAQAVDLSLHLSLTKTN